MLVGGSVQLKHTFYLANSNLQSKRKGYFCKDSGLGYVIFFPSTNLFMNSNNHYIPLNCLFEKGDSRENLGLGDVAQGQRVECACLASSRP